MGRPRIDLTGQRFHRLRVVDSVIKKGYLKWVCECDCGKVCIQSGFDLRSGKVKSCGCLNDETRIINNKKYKTKRNEYVIVGDYVEVTLANTDDKMLCDIDDWDKLKDWTWHKNGSGYAQANEKDTRGKCFKFHRKVINCPKDKVIDHINRNKLDNRKCNLRCVTQYENCQNR